MNSKIYRRTIFLCCSIAFLLGILTQYVEEYYRVDLSAMSIYNSIKIESKEFDGMSIYGDPDSRFGIIFYPGAKVEYKAYEPLMKKLASKGFFCVSIEMPYNIPFFGIDAADGIQNKYPLVDKWYMMGHSLGGSMAGTYLADNYRKYDGLILLASYVTNDLTHTDLDVISIYGTEDKVLNMDKYNKYKVNLPDGYQEMIIDGGNHAYYGVYGEQKGDGQAKISNEQQIKQTVDILRIEKYANSTTRPFS
jgi:hypothetical protein